MNKKTLIFIGVGILIAGLGVGGYFFLMPRCPESCDDGNPCTQDFCSKETNYKCSYTKLTRPQPGCLAEVTCGKESCEVGVCRIDFISDCCGNEICEVGEAYEACPTDCPNCDDNNECTKDYYDYYKHQCINTPILDVICCGNTVCETGETYENCARDCPNCDDDNKCTKDSYDYHQRKCLNEIIIPCCGNGICDKDAETYSNCPTDCPNCDDDNECTKDSYDYPEQKCVNEIIIPCCGNGICDEGVETYLICSTDCPNCDDSNKLTGDSFNYATQKCEYITYYFFDDFDEGFTSWGLESRDPRWVVVFPEDGTNGMLTTKIDEKGGYTAYTTFGDKEWTDYTFNLKVKLEQEGGAHVYIRRQPAEVYAVFITEDHLILWKDIKPAINLEVKEYSFALNQFYDIKIEVEGENLKVYVNNNLEISYTDKDNPLLWGNVGLEPMTKAYFDDIIVEALR